jgi:hypothetical protein
MTDPERISVEETRQKVSSESALLVCAYDADDKFKQFNLDGAMSLGNFKSKEDGLDKSKELIFYCA